TAIADFSECFADQLEIKRARSGFMAAWVVCDMHMGDEAATSPDLSENVETHSGGVEDVEEQTEIGPTGCSDSGGGAPGRLDEIAGHSAGAHRLNEDGDAALARFPGGIGQVFHVTVPMFLF